MNVTLRFGASTFSWPVSSADFVFQQRGATCIGAFIAIDTAVGSSVPPWIVGDTFLKNVYSVYRASTPPAVGFAQLSQAALTMNGRNGPAPSPTVGKNPAIETATETATAGLREKSNGARRGVGSGLARWVAIGAALVAGSLVL